MQKRRSAWQLFLIVVDIIHGSPHRIGSVTGTVLRFRSCQIFQKRAGRIIADIFPFSAIGTGEGYLDGSSCPARAPLLVLCCHVGVSFRFGQMLFSFDVYSQAPVFGLNIPLFAIRKRDISTIPEGE